MFRFLLVLVCFSVLGQLHATTGRGGDPNSLEGQYFGDVHYDGRRREVGILLNPVQGEKGNYYGIVFEYLNPLRERDFIRNFVRPGSRGYLQELYEWVQIYKFEKTNDPMVYELRQLSVYEGEIYTQDSSFKGELKLSHSTVPSNPLRNAVLTKNIKGKDIRLIMNRVRRFPLRSTWEYDYVPGNYNPGYKQSDEVILTLKDDYDTKTRRGTALFDVTKLKGEEIVIQGAFSKYQAHPGMYTFLNDQGAQTKGAHHITDKIGVYIDVYNAQPVMNTFELVLIDPIDAFNSQMYFEEFGNEK